MNGILLINRIDVKKFNKEKKRIFFLVGNGGKENIENHLMDTINKIEFLNKEDIVYKYNGVEIFMKEKRIPIIIKFLIDDGMDIYSVYELYDPMD